jgi:hypothetical protein
MPLQANIRIVDRLGVVGTFLPSCPDGLNCESTIRVVFRRGAPNRNGWNSVAKVLRVKNSRENVLATT